MPTRDRAANSLAAEILAVWLEDQCETSEADAQQVTLLEALHDSLTFPMQSLFTISVVAVVGTAWSLYDRITLRGGDPLPNRPATVLEYVKPLRVGPQPGDSESFSATDPIAWLGCVRAYRDSWHILFRKKPDLYWYKYQHRPL